MENDRDFFECSEEIEGPIVSNVVSCNSIHQLIHVGEELGEQEVASQVTIEKLHETLNTAYNQLKQSQFMEAIRSLNTYWKHITSQDINWRLRLCYYLNMACAYQGVWNLQMCDSTCEITQNEINSVIIELTDVEDKIKLQLILVILRMQHCAIYSQMGLHEKALTTAQQNLVGLKQCLSNILASAERLNEGDLRAKTMTGTVSFRNKTQRYLQLLKSLITDITSNITIDSYAKRPIFYNWKNNPDTNQKFIRHTFAGKHILTKDEQSRSLLGLQQDDSNTWISQFNIGSIMHMSPFSYDQLEHSPSIYQETQKKKLYEKVIYASVLNFTIATEMRFIDSQNSESTIASLKIKADSNYRSKTSQLSELHHLKAIELMCKGISSKSPYLNHLINSYHKHYVQSLVCINEEESFLTEMRSRMQSKDKKQQDYFNGDTTKNILPQVVTTTPNMKKIKQIKSNDFRKTSKSLEIKRKRNDRQGSLRQKNSELKSPSSSKGLKVFKEFPVKKSQQPLKINILKKAISNKDCQLRMTTKSETEIKLIMNSKRK